MHAHIPHLSLLCRGFLQLKEMEENGKEALTDHHIQLRRGFAVQVHPLRGEMGAQIQALSVHQVMQPAQATPAKKPFFPSLLSIFQGPGKRGAGN